MEKKISAVQRKISAVQRWLERCLVACRSRSWENALSDMECAAAELKNARESLWEIVGQPDMFPRRKVFARSVGTVITATIFVLMAAFPLASPEAVCSGGGALAWQDQKALLELVTLDEQKILMLLRKNLSRANLATASLSVPELPEKIQSRKIKASQPETPSSVTRGTSSRRGVPLEEMMSLLEIGQRALRSDGGLVVLENAKE